MNLKEGTRRLALLLGVAGAIGGGCGSYLELREVLAQRARHDKFEQLANLGEVQQERKCRLLGYDSGCFRMKLPPGATLFQQEATQRRPFTVYGPDGNQYQFPEGTDKAAAVAYFKRKGIGSTKNSATAATSQHDPFAATAEPPTPEVSTTFPSEAVTPLASEMNTGGIKAINWTQGKEYGVASIDTEDGQFLYPTPVPSRWLYLFAALLPLVGFLIPWGAIRAIGWWEPGSLPIQSDNTMCRLTSLPNPPNGPDDCR